jgi:hypothetical protein
MLDLFTTRYHLAYPETRDFYPLFLEYVEIWNIYLSKAISGEVIRAPPRREGQTVLQAPRAKNAAATG